MMFAMNKDKENMENTSMKALLINGSPRANGCTYTALTELRNTQMCV